MISRIPDGLPLRLGSKLQNFKFDYIGRNFRILLSPQILMEMNREPYCFVNLAYDSGKDDFEEIRFLAMAISCKLNSDA